MYMSKHQIVHFKQLYHNKAGKKDVNSCKKCMISKEKITTSSREILVKIYKVDEKNQEILTEDVTIGMTQN